MATEPLEYKITFDTSEVAQKLAEVKNSMDIAFGAQAFNAAGPDIYPFQQLFKGTALTNLTSAVPTTFDTPGAITSALTSVQDGVNMAQNTFSDVQNIFNTVAETSRLGYSKFTRDLEMTGLMAGSMRGAPQPLTYGQLHQEIRQGDFFDDIIKGKLGVGYSTTMPMSKAEYKEAYKKETMADFMEPSWGEAAGAALGVGAAAAFSAGPVGWAIAGLGVASIGAKAALYPFTSELRHQRALEGFVGGTSWRFLSGQFGKGDREDLGEFLRELPKQEELAARDYSRGEVDEMLSTFTEAGGYDYVRSAAEYKEKTKKLFEGHRELMHTLHVSSKEAVALMGQLSRDLGVENFKTFSAEVGVLADRAGLTRSEAASFIMKSSEMVRGTGYDIDTFALGAGRMLEDVRDMARVGIISNEDLRHFGGEQGIARSMARSAMNFAGSPMGFVSQAALMSAQLGGGVPGGPETALGQMASMGIQGQLGATAGLLSSPMAFARFFGAQQRLVDEIGPEMLMQQKTMRAVEESQLAFQRTRFTSEELYGTFRARGYSHQEAREMTTIRDAASRDDLPTKADDYRIRASELLRQEEEEGETRFGRKTRKVMEAVDRGLWTPVTGIAESAYIGIEDISRDAGRKLGRFWYDITGGAFEVESTKLKGLATAWEIGGEYADSFEDLIELDTVRKDILEKRVLEEFKTHNIVPRQITKIEKIELSAEEKKNLPYRAGRLGGGYLGMAPKDHKSVIKKYTIDQLKNIDEVRRETAEMLYEEEEYTPDITPEFFGSLQANPIGAFVSMISNAISNEPTKILGKTADYLDLTETELISDLARMAYTAEMSYQTDVEAGIIKPPSNKKTPAFMKQETSSYFLEDLEDRPQIQENFKLGYLRKKYESYMSTGKWSGVISKDANDIIDFMGNLSPDKQSTMFFSGMAEMSQETKLYNKERRDIAVSRLLAKGIEKPSEAAIAKETKNIDTLVMQAELFDVKAKDIQGQIEGMDIYKGKLADSFKKGMVLFGGENEAGGTVFSEQAARVVTANNINEIASTLATGIIRVAVIEDKAALSKLGVDT